MRSPNHPGRWLIAPALLLAFCSRGNAPSVVGPSPAAPVGVAQDGVAGASATGDVKVGTGALEFLNLALWGFNGDPGAGGYVNPGGTYGMTPGVAVKLWATYVEGSPANPKFMVDWGDGSEPSTGGCGACKATHTYAIPGLYTVKATLDDRVSTMVTRIFQLDARPTPTPTPTPSPTPTPTCSVPPNVALGTPITPITNTILGKPADVTDGNTVTTWWSYQGGSYNTNSFTIDLGSVHSISSVDLTIWQTFGYELFSSTDGSTWISRSKQDYGTSTGGTVGPFGGGYTARYFKHFAYANHNQYVGVGELEVYGCD